ADELLGYALGVDRVVPNAEVPANVRRRFDRMIARRASGEPGQLIPGPAVFGGLQMRARAGVFVARDSTEYLAEQAVRRLRGRRRPVAVDLAAGGGTVALAIANEVPGVRVFGTDISLTAVRVARQNAELLRLRATFAKGDLFDGLPSDLLGRVDVITLHPPYVARDELHELPEEIRRFEPVHTLTDRSPDGLGLVGRTAPEAPRWLKPGGWLLVVGTPAARGGRPPPEAPRWLKPGGWLLVEVSPDRARSAASVLRRNGFGDVRSTMDRGFKVTRVLVGRWHGSATR